MATTPSVKGENNLQYQCQDEKKAKLTRSNLKNLIREELNKRVM